MMQVSWSTTELITARCWARASCGNRKGTRVTLQQLNAQVWMNMQFWQIDLRPRLAIPHQKTLFINALTLILKTCMTAAAVTTSPIMWTEQQQPATVNTQCRTWISFLRVAPPSGKFKNKTLRLNCTRTASACQCSTPNQTKSATTPQACPNHFKGIKSARKHSNFNSRTS